MKIRIYQINMERDSDRVSFMALESLQKNQGAEQINSRIYDRIYEADVACCTLEDVYRMFNLEHPADFNGHSLSVSDIVEVMDEQTEQAVQPGFYFCDTVGFQRVEFDPTQAQVKETTMRVVICEPGKPARIAMIKPGLESLQSVVGGYIEPYYAFEEEVCIVCNEEGKINGMALNRAIYVEKQPTEMSYSELSRQFREAESKGEHLSGLIVFTEDSFTDHYSEESRTYSVSSQNKAFQPGMGGYSIYASAIDGSDPMVRLECYMTAERGGEDGWVVETCFLKHEEKELADVIAGTFLICDCSGSDFGSLSKEQAERYRKQFQHPERFYRENGAIKAVPYNPEKETER